MGKRRWRTKRALALSMAFCVASTGVIAYADDDVNLIEESLIEATGTTTGDLEAQGRFYPDYVSLEDELEAGNQVHLQMVEEGQVLLKNDNGALPLAESERNITFLGMGTIDYVRGGGGSGSTSATSYALDWIQAFEQEGFSINPKTINLYENLFALNGGKHDDAASGGLLEPDMSYYGKSVTSTFQAYNDVAVVCISRFGRENVDLKTNNVPGHSNEDDHYLQLDDNELELIKLAKANFKKVVVMLNSSMIMQIPELEAGTDTEYGVDAILWVGGIGDQGTLAAARILTGEVNPSGHTPDIWYSDFTKDPTFTNYGDMSQNKDADGNRMNSWFIYPDGESSVYSSVEFREGIYYGYRYYETKADDMNAASEGSGDEWYAQNVLYPFGYGLSYTDFEWKLAGISADKTITAPNQTITMQVEVENTGSVAGKDVVEVYYTAPYTAGGIEKSSVNLVGYAKTDLLQPGEKEVVSVEFVAQDMASFDWDDANENDFMGYELEAGSYVISARRNSHDVVLSETYQINETILCETDYTTGETIEPVLVDDFDTTRDSLLENMMSRADGLEQPAAQTAEERVMSEFEAAILDAEETYYPYMDEEGQPWYVSEVPEGWTQGAEKTVQEADLAGKIYTEPTVTDGVAVAAEDEVSQAWDAYMNSLTWEELVGIVAGGGEASEGPVQFAGGTCWQSAPVTAATWNQELVREQGMIYANHGLLTGNKAWNGIACNIHRSPFNGRTFEYYSEDPLLSATNAAIIVECSISKGIINYAKHFFANVQEHNRADYGGVCTFATEQVFREIYMKSFEKMVKAGSMGLMTSFNRVGYVVNSNNWAIHEDLLRGEWGFHGGTMTDAWCRDYCSIDLMARAGDDTVLSGNEGFTKTYITAGTWDSTQRDGKGMVLVPTEDGSSEVVSPTHYYAVRKSAQRILQTRVNSNQYKNFASSYNLQATVYYGTGNSANIQCEDTADFSVTLQEGQELPLGLTVEGFVVSYEQPVIGELQEGDEGYQSGWFADNSIYGDYPAQGVYEVMVDMSCDGYITVPDVKLTINVISPFQVNDENMMATADSNPVIEITKGEAVDILIDSEPFAYQAMITQGQITNWYTKNDAKYLRDEEKTHADGTTIPYSEVEEKHELSYSIEGDLPEGITAEVQTGAAYGLRTNKEIEVATGLKLSGTAATPGEYTVTVRENVPYCKALAGIWLLPTDELTVEQNFTIVVE